MIELGDGLGLLVDRAGNQRIIRVAGDPPAPQRRQSEAAWYVPYTAVHPLTASTAPPDATWVDVSCSPVAYWAALRAIWARGETFALLEHDVVCRSEVTAELDACSEPWCVFPYDFCHVECREAWRNMLGCTRFRAEMIAAVPDAVSLIPADNRDWHNMCDGLGANLRAAGFTHHWHGPPVEHHRETHRL